jgi:hypothetical protein
MIMSDLVASAGALLRSYDSRLLFRAPGSLVSTETCYPDGGIVYEFGYLFISVSC